MIARLGRRVWLAARTAVRGLRRANDEQVRMWECLLLSSAVAATETGPLRWVPSLDGHRLVGSYLGEVGSRGRGAPDR
jgi:hypothetical protein